MPSDRRVPEWSGRPILEADHVSDLEQRAAVAEFRDRLPRAEAEAAAHREYRREHHLDAAAHHLRGMRAAQASGDGDDAKKHRVMYDLHLKEMGVDGDEVPADVRARAAASEGKERAYKFRPHRGDAFVVAGLGKAEGDPPDNVVPFGPRKAAADQKKKAASKEKVAGALHDAVSIMASDPGFQAAARQRDAEAKAAKLKAGGAWYKPGAKVRHVDAESYPWEGTVASHQYRDDDVDGPGHYYEVRWWDPKQRQYHEDYLHQDNLVPPQTLGKKEPHLSDVKQGSRAELRKFWDEKHAEGERLAKIAAAAPAILAKVGEELRKYMPVAKGSGGGTDPEGSSSVAGQMGMTEKGELCKGCGEVHKAGDCGAQKGEGDAAKCPKCGETHKGKDGKSVDHATAILMEPWPKVLHPSDKRTKKSEPDEVALLRKAVDELWAGKEYEPGFTFEQ
jgi:hypothetical protein